MAKKFTSYSKLSKDRKEQINELLETGDVKLIDVNDKRGLITYFDDEEYLVVLDHLSREYTVEDDDDDEDEELEDEELELDEDMEE
jgi:hypothetical protein